MGNVKNKIGGAPKQKGRLVAALAKSQAATLVRAKQATAAEHREERAKASASGATQAQMKKKRKMERAAEREEEKKEEELRVARAALEAAAGIVADAAAEGVEVVVEEGKGKRKREERERKKGTIPYGLGQKILLVGEGNFSFAHSLLLISPPTVTPHLLLATSFDTLEVAAQKYPDLMLHVDAIREKGAKVVFGVDATSLKKCKEVKEGREFDRVAFNFPHVGAGITDQNRNIRANQTLILQFLRSVTPFLRKGASASTDLQNPIRKSNKLTNWTSKKTNKKRPKANSDDEADQWAAEAGEGQEGEIDPDDVDLTYSLNQLPPTTAGTVLITIRTAAPYSLWSLAHLGTRGSLIANSILPRPLPTTPQPNFKIVRSFEFSPADYEGYEHRRTIGFKEGVSSAANDDLTLSARERGEKRREEKERSERAEKEDRAENSSTGAKGKEIRGIMRTWEFEAVPVEDADDLYD